MYSFRIRASRRAAFLAIGFSLCVAAAAWAANPKITLKLQNVTIAEAMEALGKAGGVPLDFRGEAEEQTQRASFDWQDLPLSRAMRELAAKFQLGFSSFGIGNGYHFVPLGKGPVPGPSKYVLERKGVQVSLNELTVQAQRAERFAGQQAQEDSSSIGLQFTVQLTDGDAETIAGIANLTAKDDQGNVLVSFGPVFPSPFERALPDEWTGRVNLPGYDPQARKLVWVEGEVQRYGLFQDNAVEFSLPVAPGAAHKEGKHLMVDVKKLELPEEGRESASAELQITTPPQERPATFRFGGGGVKLILVGASGKQYHPNSTESMGRGGQGVRVSAMTCRWGRVPEKVVTLRVVSQERGDPEPLLAFRLTDVPLPRGGVFLRRKDTDSRRLPGEKAPEHAFFDPAGGTLTGQLRVPRMSGLTGDVSYGLSPVSPDEKSATRWIDVPLQADGSARLEHVKPGKYRVLRVFRPDEVPKVSEHGHWLHAEETVQVVAGKETVLPPFEWSPAANPPARSSK